MDIDEIKAEAESYLEWPSDRREFVTYHSAMLFAQHCVELALRREKQKDEDDHK